MRFTFEITKKVNISASNISSAIEKILKENPDCELTDINNIDNWKGNSIPYELSSITHERIYYEPGCPCRVSGCSLDPMVKIARACCHQSEMTDDKYRTCNVNDDPKDKRCPIP